MLEFRLKDLLSGTCSADRFGTLSNHDPEDLLGRLDGRSGRITESFLYPFAASQIMLEEVPDEGSVRLVIH